MTIQLDEARRERLNARLRASYQEEFDEHLSSFRAEQLLDFTLSTLGPQIYNQAVQDALAYMHQRLADLDVEVHALDEG